MKKIIIGILALVCLPAAAVYIFIPAKLTLLSQIKPGSSSGTLQRATGASDLRHRWLPVTGKQLSKTAYTLDDCTYIFPADNSISNAVIIEYKKMQVASFISTEPTDDSVILNWVLNRQSSYNPVSRIQDLYKLKHIKKTNEKILASLLSFVNNNKTVYGINIKRTVQTDSTLITYRSTADTYPSVELIYCKLELLKQYAQANGAAINKPPMLNITQTGKSSWDYMVALPINKELENRGDILAKRMFAGGKILETENISGGFKTVDRFVEVLDLYRRDFNYISPAIPFQSLITDRAKETDSSKWITRLYYPIY